MYVKLFASLYQGTLRGKPDEILVFTNLLAHADKDGVVDIHWRAIADEVGLPPDRVKAAIENLEMPDSESRSPEEDGKRLIRLDEHRAWGWRVTNYAKYRGIKNEDERREQNRVAQEKWRNKNKQPSSDVNESNQDKPIQKQKQKHINTSSENPDDVAVADEILSLILKINPKHKPPNIQKWAACVRLMVGRDSRTRDEIRELFAWANADSFWQANILSPAKLREKWDVLFLQKTRKLNGQDHRPSKPSLAERATNARKEFERSIGVVEPIDGQIVGEIEPHLRA